MKNEWSSIYTIEKVFVGHLNLSGVEINTPRQVVIKDYDIYSRSWVSDKFLLANLTILDARTSIGMWMLHCCVYPHFNNPSPIYGFDIVAGKNKITGFFHDFSPTSPELNELSLWFEEITSYLSWNKTRQIPDWGVEIFSKNMIAASNVQNSEELATIYDLALSTLPTYLSKIGTRQPSFEGHNSFSTYINSQKKNQHTPRVLQSIGFTEDQTLNFIETHLFPNSITH